MFTILNLAKMCLNCIAILQTDDIVAKLKELAPNGVDAYFDNVGGRVSDAVWSAINKYGKIAQCGMISTYNR